MDYLPVFYRITDQPCLVVGGGSIAARKAELLLKANGKVRVVATRIGEAVRELTANKNLVYEEREFRDSDVVGNVCVIAATDDQQLNSRISRLAREQNIPVNVVDNPDFCSFIMPSMIDRNPVQIAISTGGASPVLARMLRAKFESAIPGTYGELAKLTEAFRGQVKQAFATVDKRRRRG